jgi:hypothetical protein
MTLDPFVIQGNYSSCESDAISLGYKKASIDKAKSNINITPSQKELLRKWQEDYDASKKRYDEAGCGKDALKDKCFGLQYKITSHQSSIRYALVTRNTTEAAKLQAELDKFVSDFKSSNCEAKISQTRGEYTMSVSDEFKKLDKERIEAESKYQQKQRLFFGVIVFFGAVLMVTMFSKSK